MCRQVVKCNISTYILLAFSGVSNSLYRQSTCCSLDSLRTLKHNTQTLVKRNLSSSGLAYIVKNVTLKN